MALLDELSPKHLPAVSPPDGGLLEPAESSPPILHKTVPPSPAAPSNPSARPPGYCPSKAFAAPNRFEWMLLLVALTLSFLLASFPARNSDVWMHLAAGRRLAHGESSLGADLQLPADFRVNTTWLYDLLCYGLYAAFGGVGLVLFKAMLVVAIAFLMLRLSWTGRGWEVPAVCTVLALLPLSIRLLLQPATFSYLFLALTLWLVRRGEETCVDRPPSLLPSWPLMVLFVVWVNLDSWFVLGLGTVALVWMGQALDGIPTTKSRGGPEGRVAFLLRRGFSFALLVAVCLLNPNHYHAFALPQELGWMSPSGSAGAIAWESLRHPFQGAYLTNLGRNRAGWAYFPLLGLGLLSFVLNLPRWPWRRALPWLTFAVMSAIQVRTIPFFAVLAGPVLAWNLQEFLARHFDPVRRQRAIWQWGLLGGRVLTAFLGVGLLVCAWPGWLQSPPYERRSWAIQTSPSLESGALTTGRWRQEGKLGSDILGLHLSPETANAFAWFCPAEKGLLDDRLASAIRGDRLVSVMRGDRLASASKSDPEDMPEAQEDWAERMRSLHVNHVIVHDPDQGRLRAALDRLLTNPLEWPLLYFEGDVAVFGWRDPAKVGANDLFKNQELDLNRLAYHPAENKKAPPRPPEEEGEMRPWWEAFWKLAPPWPKDRDEAKLHLIQGEVLLRSAPLRHSAAWEGYQAAALLGAAAAWSGPGALLDADLRLTLLQPLYPAPGSKVDSLPVPDQIALMVMENFRRQRDDTPLGLLYLSVRAARRAIASNPEDAQAYLVLGESYWQLLHTTRERSWAAKLPELAELRHAQASAALNRAVAIKPDYPKALLDLYGLYTEMGCFDLALENLQAYVRYAHEAGPSAGVSAKQFSDQEAGFKRELSRLGNEVEYRITAHGRESVGTRVLDRAILAKRRGLIGKARDLLLKSDVADFGIQGMAMELDLKLKTGQAQDVYRWTETEQTVMKDALSPSFYHWLRTQALAASGNYALAKMECAELAGLSAESDQDQKSGKTREVLNLLIGQTLLNELPRATPNSMWAVFSRIDFERRLADLVQSLKSGADGLVLRGLIALEEGEVDEAKADFRKALSFWRNEAAAASGGGLEFNGLAIAKSCLELLK